MLCDGDSISAKPCQASDYQDVDLGSPHGNIGGQLCDEQHVFWYLLDWLNVVRNLLIIVVFKKVVFLVETQN